MNIIKYLAKTIITRLESYRKSIILNILDSLTDNEFSWLAMGKPGIIFIPIQNVESEDYILDELDSENVHLDPASSEEENVEVDLRCMFKCLRTRWDDNCPYEDKEYMLSMFDGWALFLRKEADKLEKSKQKILKKLPKEEVNK